MSFAAIAAARAPASVAAVWAAVPLIGILTQGVTTRTYLVEASFGLAMLVGVAGDEILERLRSDVKRLRPAFARVVWVGLAALFRVAVLVYAPASRVRLHALSVISASRENFRDAVLFTRDHLDSEGHHLVLVEYDELGIQYERDVRGGGHVDKAQRQKTMVGKEMQMLLRLHGATHVEVHNLTWFREDGAGQVFFLAMNRGERGHILGLGLALDLLCETERAGEGAWIYRLAGGQAHDGDEEIRAE